MFVNVFKKTYLVNESDIREKSLKTNMVYSLDNYKETKEEYPTLLHFYEDIYRKQNTNGSIRILSVKDVDFDAFLLDWAAFLGLNFYSIHLILEHSDFCTKCNDEVSDIISGDNYEFQSYDYLFRNYKPFKKIKNNYSFFPAEFAINSALNGEEWAVEKYDYFRMYRLYFEAKKIQMKLYQSGKRDKFLDSVLKDGDQSIKPIWNDDKKKKELVSYLISLGLDNSYNSFLNCSLNEFILMNSDFGYNHTEMWKFNWNLANYLREINFTLE